MPWARLRGHPGGSDSKRLIFGRGGLVDGLPDVNVDWFDPVLVVTLYGERDVAWWDGARSEAAGLCEGPVDAVVVQRRDLSAAPSEVLAGTLPEQLWARRGELRFELSLAGRNLGFFQDMSPAHAWIQRHAEGASVLNLFAYTCAFSVFACAGGASRVVNVDMSKRAIAIGQRNQRHNDQSASEVRYLPHDLFKSWGKLKKLGPYDCVVVDPPSYQFKSFVLERDYPKVLRRLESLTNPGAHVLLCMNHSGKTPDQLVAMAAEHAPELTFVERLPPAPDHLDASPDAALKMLVFQRAT